MQPIDDPLSEQPFRLGPRAVALLSETYPETTLPDGRPARLVVSTLGTDVYLTEDSLTVDGYWDEPDLASKFREASQEEGWKTLRILGTRPDLSALLRELPSPPDESSPCAACLATGWIHFEGVRAEIICFVCSGLGWTQEPTLPPW